MTSSFILTAVFVVVGGNIQVLLSLRYESIPGIGIKEAGKFLRIPGSVIN